VWAVGAPLEYVKTRTFQNLARSNFRGHYLSVDPGGAPVVSPVSNFDASGTYWEIKPYFWKDRGYTTHTIVQRGNNAFNGKYLAVDSQTGALVFVDEEIPSARWLIRSGGKFQGWDSFYIQNLAKSGTFDMNFLAIDETTGAVILTNRPTAGSHWYLGE